MGGFSTVFLIEVDYKMPPTLLCETVINNEVLPTILCFSGIVNFMTEYKS